MEGKLFAIEIILEISLTTRDANVLEAIGNNQGFLEDLEANCLQKGWKASLFGEGS